MSVVLPLRVGGDWFTIDAGLVVEILGARAWFPIPDAPNVIPGVLVWRGRAVPALDLAAALGAEPALSPGERRSRTVVLRAGASTVAIPVDAVREAQEYSDDPDQAPRSWAATMAQRFVDIEAIVAIETAAPAPHARLHSTFAPPDDARSTW